MSNRAAAKGARTNSAASPGGSFLATWRRKAGPSWRSTWAVLVNRFGRQAEIKYQITADAMNAMGYKAVGFGPKDLRLPAESLVAVTSGEANPFVSANVNLFDLTQPSRVVEVAGKKIGITSVLGDKYQAEINNDQLALSPAQTAIEKVLPKLRAAELRPVDTAGPRHAGRERGTGQALSWISTSSPRPASAEEPPHLLKTLDGQKTAFVEVGHKGKYAIVLGLYDNAKEPWRYRRVPLDARFADCARDAEAYGGLSRSARTGWFRRSGAAAQNASPRNKARRSVRRVRRLGEVRRMPQDGIRYLEQNQARPGDAIAGDRHTAAAARSGMRELPCHRLEPAGVLSFRLGLREPGGNAATGRKRLRELSRPRRWARSGRSGPDLTLRDQMRQAMRLTKATVELNICVKCHDGDNDPHFAGNFEKYWPKVEHKGMK